MWSNDESALVLIPICDTQMFVFLIFFLQKYFAAMMSLIGLLERETGHHIEKINFSRLR